MVEHSIGNGEVDSSILSGSTIIPLNNKGFESQPLPVPPLLEREQKSNLCQNVGENAGTLFATCSADRLRARRVSRLYAVSYATASTIAKLAYAVAR